MGWREDVKIGVGRIGTLYLGNDNGQMGVEVTATPAELNLMDGVTATAAEINYLDITTLGTGAASKAVVLDAGDDYIWPATGVLTYGGTAVTANGAEMNYLDLTTLGTGAASKAVVLDAGEDYIWPATGLLTYGGTAINATGAEINEACDKSAGAVVSITAATLAITQALHAGKIMTFDKIDGIDITLPEATGSGDVYTFILGTALTSDTITITTADTTNADFVGNVLAIDLDAATVAVMFSSIQATGNDTITMNMTTQGGVNIGTDWYRITDMKTDIWHVEGEFLVPTGSDPATPFSSVA